MCSTLHHVEVCVAEETKFINTLTQGFGFRITAQQKTPQSFKWVLKQGTTFFLITKRRDDYVGTNHNHRQAQNGQQAISNGDATDQEPWTAFCCRGQESHEIDSVFNAALEVKDVDAVTRRVEKAGCQVLKEPVSVRDDNGHVRYSIVTSCIGNMVHTLINKENYSGEFLPGFVTVANDNYGGDSMVENVSHMVNGATESSDTEPCIQNGTQNCGVSIETECDNQTHSNSLNKSKSRSMKGPLFTHIDHLACVCEAGRSREIMAWYDYCFGMKRFITNREESEEEGLVLGEEIGLRLKAMEYWMCAETGIAAPFTTLKDSSFKMILAEPLEGYSNSHVNTFLLAHKGPGIQHIALHTPCMTRSVQHVSQQGVAFRKAPPTYYQKGIRLEEIKAAGHEDELELFQELGILMDTEADVFSGTKDVQGKQRYLLQVFTAPLFTEETFFMEVIQRWGARGFGMGNITALARSIILFKQQQEEEESQRRREEELLQTEATRTPGRTKAEVAAAGET